MKLSDRAIKIITEISEGKLKFGDLKKRGKEIKKDQGLAMELWSSGEFRSRLLATLVFDKKLLTEGCIEEFASDLFTHNEEERNQIGDWLLANQLTKDKKLVALLESWETHASSILRRFFWYHQARLRWTGKIQDNSAALLDSLEANMATEESEVQWTMNFCAGWIGIFEPKLRSRCIKLGKKLGLYKDEKAAKNCTPSYLPEFIRIEAAKRE